MFILAADAEKVVGAALAKAEELGQKVTITVVDGAGDIAALRRQDASPSVNFDLSYGMAYTSVSFGGMRGEVLGKLADSSWFRAASVMRGGRLMASKGALPLKRDGQLLGAIGVSGGSEAGDVEIAEAGVAALG